LAEGSGLGEAREYVCRSLDTRDEEEVKRLVKNAFREFLDGEYWDWKYKQNPDFDPSLVMVAEKDGRVIGCDHWLLKDLRLSPTLEVKAVLGADIVVNPEFRGKGVGKALLVSLRYSETVKRKNPVIIYMFADVNLAQNFYTPTGGYIPPLDRTASYIKILNWRKVKENAKLLNEEIRAGKFRSRLAGFELKVLFKIVNAPSLCFHIAEDGIQVSEGDECPETADIVVRSDLATLQKMNCKRGRKTNLFRAALTGQLKFRGKTSKLLSFYRNLWIIEQLFSRRVI